MNIRKLLLAAALIATFGLPMLAKPVHASPQGNTITVNTTNDEFNTVGAGAGCSLREAIQAANADQPFGGCPAGDGADTILLDAHAYLLQITGDDDLNQVGDFDITSDVIIQGKGVDQTTVNGQQIDRVFDVLPNTTVEFHNMAIRNGDVMDQLGFGGGIRSQGTSLQLLSVSIDTNWAQWGGGIYHSGMYLYMERVNMRFNHAKTFGGAIMNSGPLWMVDSTLDTNYGTSGAGLYNEDSAYVMNSTFSGNRAKTYGGGIATALENEFHPPASSLDLANVTITANHADELGQGHGDGGGIFVLGEIIVGGIPDSTQVYVRNTIIAGNFDDSGDGPLATMPDCSGALISSGYNLIGNGNGCTGVTNNVNGDQVGDSSAPIDPLLKPLDNYGGPTKTHALQASSPAVDKGNVAGCLNVYNQPILFDQRGYLRPVDGGSSNPRCDIGAFEFKSVPPSACRAIPAAPKLRKPEDNAQVHVTQPLLDWYAVPCAKQYNVVVRRDSNNGDIVFKTTVVDSEVQTSSLKALHTYYWAVSACDKAGCKQSTWFHFTINR
jgi:CSLREA domain-containing protein